MPQVSLSPSVELFPRLVGKNSINTNLEKKGRFTFFAFFFCFLYRSWKCCSSRNITIYVVCIVANDDRIIDFSYGMSSAIVRWFGWGKRASFNPPRFE